MSGIFKYNQNSTPNRRSHYGTLFCGSSNQTQDATMDNSYSMGLRSPSMSMLSGGGTPAQGRSLREFEEQMTALRKDNFNLKLRIYFLEENISAGNHGDAFETYFKQNIDLKVEVEALRKDVQEKQELLCQAGKAMELMEESQNNSEKHHQGIIDELNQKVGMLELEIRSLEKNVEYNKTKFNETGLLEFIETMECKDMDVAQKVKVLELENVIRQFHEQNEEMCKKIESSQAEIGEKCEKIKSLEKTISDLRYESAEMREKLEENDKSTADFEVEKLKTQLFECRKQIAEKMCILDDTNDKLKEKSTAYDNACLAIQKYMSQIKVLEKENQALKRNSGILVSETFAPASEILDKNNQPITQEEYDDVVEKKKSLQQKVDDLIHKVCSNSSDRNENIIIQQLNDELIEARNEAEKELKWRKECVEICGTLTGRLEELAGFLDSLLRNKDFSCSISIDRRKAIRYAVDSSLNLSRSLNNMSLSVTHLSLPENSLANLSLTGYLEESILEENKENNGNVGSQAKIIEKLCAENKALRGELEKNIKKKDKKLTSLLVDQLSDSEAWSEPDRDVSLARIGLDEKSAQVSKCGKSLKFQQNILQDLSSTSENESNIFFKKPAIALSDAKGYQDEITVLNKQLNDKDGQLLDVQCRLVESDNRSKEDKLIFTESLTRAQKEVENYKRLYISVEKEIKQFKEHNNYNEELTIVIKEKDETIEKLKKEKEQAFIDLRVANMKLETLRTEYAEQQQKHKSDLDNFIIKEQERLEKIKNDLKESFEQIIRENDDEHQLNLAQNYVSKHVFDDKLNLIREMQDRLEDVDANILLMTETEAKLKHQIIEKEKSIQALRKNLDETTLQTSKAALERTKALNEKRTLEDLLKLMQDDFDKVKMEKNELNTRLSQLENINAKLQNQLINATIVKQDAKKVQAKSEASHSGYTSEEMAMTHEERKVRHENSSPDLGIESDAGRLSNVETRTTTSARPLLKTLELTQSMSNLLSDTDIDAKSENKKYLNTSSGSAGDPPANPLSHDCVKIEQEYAELKRKYLRTRRCYEETVNKIRISNQRKEEVERVIQRQIQKTNTVLRTVRKNMENELEIKSNKGSSSNES